MKKNRSQNTVSKRKVKNNVGRIVDAWVDSRGNAWTCDRYTQMRASSISISMPTCYRCLNCSNCSNCQLCVECAGIDHCRDCTHCVESCDYCKSCYACSNCSNCKACRQCQNCRYSENSESCSNSSHIVACAHCNECRYCNACTDCSYLRHSRDCDQLINSNHCAGCEDSTAIHYCDCCTKCEDVSHLFEVSGIKTSRFLAVRVNGLLTVSTVGMECKPASEGAQTGNEVYLSAHITNSTEGGYHRYWLSEVVSCLTTAWIKHTRGKS